MRKFNNLITGQLAEEQALAEYVKLGYVPLEQNWRCNEGELDLIVAKRSLIVFCEVKYRSTDRHGLPVVAVTAAKQRRIRELAVRWLGQSKARYRDIRFDVAAVTPTSLELIEDCV